MLTSKERQIIDDIHDFMAYTDNHIKDRRDKKIPNVNYKEIPEDATILLFGGYKMIGFHAVDAIKAYHAQYKKWPNLMITGKSSNKYDNTAGLGSEVNAYQYILENCGVPRSVVRKHYLEPKDTSTAENTQSVEAILEAYPDLQNKPIVLFTQSYYSRRAVHDFAQKLPQNDLIVANLPKADFDNGLFPQDRIDGNAVDVMIGACFYQSMYNQARWEKEETLSPSPEELAIIPKKEQIKPIVEKYCGWLYPNNMIDLGLSDSLMEAKQQIEERKSKLFAQQGFSAEQQKSDIFNAVALYRKQHGIGIENTSNKR